MQKITTFLWFDTQAEEAAQHYTSIFDDSRVVNVQRYGEAGPGEPGTAMTVTFELAGQQFIEIKKSNWSTSPRRCRSRTTAALTDPSVGDRLVRCSSVSVGRWSCIGASEGLVAVASAVAGAGEGLVAAAPS